jgi:hypothetical protein
MAVRVRVAGSGTLVAWKGRTEKVTDGKGDSHEIDKSGISLVNSRECHDRGDILRLRFGGCHLSPPVTFPLPGLSQLDI